MKRHAAPLTPYLRLLLQRPGAVTLAAALLLAATLSALGLLALSGWFITATGVTAMLWAAGQRIAFDIFLPGAGIRFFALSRTVARYFERVVSHDVTLDVQARLRTRLFARLAALPGSRLHDLRDSAVLNRITADVDALDNLLLRVINPLLVSALLLVLLAAALALLVSPWLLWVPLLLLAGILPIALHALARGALPGHRLVARAERLRSRVLEGLAGLAELHSAGTLPEHAARTKALDHNLESARRRRNRAMAASEALTLMLVQSASAAALLAGLWMYGSGTISAAAAVLAALAVLGLGELLGGLPQALRQLGETRAAAARLNVLAGDHGGVNDDVTIPAHPSPAPAALRSEAPLLELHAIALSYPHRIAPALAGVDLTVARGERIAIIGASGSGKSSLLAVIGRLVEPSAGSMRLSGRHWQDCSPTEWRQQLACLTQHSALFADSIAANLRLGCADADHAALQRALHIVALDSFVDGLADGLDTWIGEHGARLSGGQARRLALARVLLRDAPLVVLDEPFSGLDAATGKIVRDRLDHWLRGRSVIMLAHDHSALPPADRTLRLRAGRPLAEATGFDGRSPAG